MATTACPLDDDRGTCNDLTAVCCLSCSPVVLGLMIILCLMEERKTEISRTAHDCHKYVNAILFIYQLFSALVCTEHMD